MTPSLEEERDEGGSISDEVTLFSWSTRTSMPAFLAVTKTSIPADSIDGLALTANLHIDCPSSREQGSHR